MPSLLSRLAEWTLRLQRRKRDMASADAMTRFIARDRRRGPSLPSRGLRRRLQVDERSFAGREVFTLTPRASEPRAAAASAERHALYLHGGSYVLDLVKYHWHFAERLARCAGVSVTVPRYPLAPEHGVDDVHAFVAALWDDLTVARGLAPERITLVGDSAGAALALVLAQALRDAGRPPPAALVLVSPWLDATCSDPMLRELDPFDPMLGIPGGLHAATLYARGADLSAPHLSPMNGRLAGLCPMTVFAGTHDMLLADARRFKALAAAQQAALEYIEVEHMIHDWPLVVLLPEARRAIDHIADIVAGTHAAGGTAVTADGDRSRGRR